MNKKNILLIFSLINFLKINSYIELDKITQANYQDGIVNAISWLIYDDQYLLAAAGQTDQEAKIKVYEFDPEKKSLKLTKINAQFDYGTVNALTWLKFGKSHYLAVGGTNGVVIYKLEKIKRKLVLNPVSGSLNCCEVNTLGWLYKNNNFYLAVAGSDKNSFMDIKIYAFDTKTELLRLTDAQASFYKGVVNSVNWLNILKNETSETFLAVGGGADTNSLTQELRIYKFDINTVTLNEKLELVASTSLHSGSVNSIHWLNDNHKYYLLSGVYDGEDKNQLKIYSFDPKDYGFQEIDNIKSFQDNFVKSVRWINVSKKHYFASATDDGGSVNEVAVYEYDPEINVIMLTDAIVASKSIISSIRWLKIKNDYYLTTAGDSTSSKGIKIYKLYVEPCVEEFDQEGHGFLDMLNSAFNSFLSLFKKSQN